MAASRVEQTGKTEWEQNRMGVSRWQPAEWEQTGRAKTAKTMGKKTPKTWRGHLAGHPSIGQNCHLLDIVWQ